MILSHIEAGVPRGHHHRSYALTIARWNIDRKFWEGTVAKHLGSLFPKELEARAITGVVLMIIAVGARAVYQVQDTAMLFNALLAIVLMACTLFAISALVLITILTAFLMIRALLAGAFGTERVHTDRVQVARFVVHIRPGDSVAQGTILRKCSERHIDMLELG